MKFTVASLATAFSALVLPVIVSGAPAALERRQNYFTSAHYDDQDSVVSYVENWTHITNDKLQLQSGTESFSKTPNA